jgi:hypothetical protein
LIPFSEEKKAFELIFPHFVSAELENNALQVIKGWELGLLDMAIGEQRILTIQPEYGRN